MTPVRKILIIKTSSLGDVVHMLPAITDANHQQADLIIDWVVEENFAEVPAWHSSIRNILPIAIRRWRKHLFSKETWQEISQFRQRLQQEHYDAIIDTQGLLKSALIAMQAYGKRYGYDHHSSREPLASLSYQQGFSVAKQRHAITRNRLLMAHALGYSIESLSLDHGIAHSTYPLPTITLPQRYVVALHGTSRVDKEWPETHWKTLLSTLAQHGISTLLPWGNVREQQRAERLAQTVHGSVQVLPPSSLGELAAILQQALGVIGMDTGLMHIAAALDKPGLALYPVTQPALTGVQGNSHPAQAMMLENLSGVEMQDADAVSQRLLALLAD